MQDFRNKFLNFFESCIYLIVLVFMLWGVWSLIDISLRLLPKVVS